jgi:hypothetical protein
MPAAVFDLLIEQTIEPFIMKRYLVLAGMILLAAIISFYEEKPRVETGESHIPSPPGLTFARMEVPPAATNSHFLDDVNLTYDPMVKIQDSAPRRASLADGKDLPSANPERIKSKPEDPTAPVITVVDSKINYELLGSKDFSLKLNLTPAYANPEALIPTRLDPGVGVTLKF